MRPQHQKMKSNALSEAVRNRDKDIPSMVAAAVRHKEVKLAYQPIVQASAQNRVAFWEGLIRVTDPTGRIIPAREFIGYVEEQETGRLLDCHALEHGLRMLAKAPDLRLSINMSARSIGYMRWQRILDRQLSANPTLAERLILEISEDSAMRVPELVTEFARRLRKKGISFALDSFGAGQTVFRHFKQLDFDILKIDGHFVANVAHDSDNQVAIRALAAVGGEFGMITVAERVETLEDAAFLASVGIDCLQGYAFSAPTLSPPFVHKP